MSGPDPAEVFRAEAQDLLERIEQGLLDLERDPGNGELVASVFRALHTLKGSGAMFGYSALASFTHHCETAFDRVRKGEAAASPELIGLVLSALDHMRALAEGGQASEEKETTLLSALQTVVSPTAGPRDPSCTGAPIDTAELATAADCAIGTDVGTGVDRAGTTGSAGPVPVSPSPVHWHLQYAPPPEAFVNGEKPLSLFEELKALGSVHVVAHTDTIPALGELVANECRMTWDIDLETTADRSAIEAVFLFSLDYVTMEVAAATPVVATTPVAATTPAAEAPIPSPVASARPTPANTTAPAAAAPPPPEAQNARMDGGAKRDVGTLRVPAERLDELMDRVAELVIAQSRLKQVTAGSTDINLRAVAEEIERLASELRDSMMFVRMVPIAQLFGRFRRLVHDLARDMGKSIELVTEGESTELDKTVIERLADPMVHLIRNAADHGLEGPAQRAAAGKAETGRIRLAARQTGAEVIISVIDDGRGIDRTAVRAKAEANGLVEKGTPLTDDELLQMIFRPGFSTAATVTDLSGRGVGMDVVKRTIEALRGSIDIKSTLGAGSQVDLRIPLTLAIIDGLLVRVGANRYVIPLAAVEECVELTREQDLRSSGRCFLTLRDTLVPFIRLRDLFATGTTPDPYQKIVVVSTGAERVGLVVDQIVGQHQTVIKPMSRFHAGVETFSGATILGDGSVALILDIAHLVSAGQKQEERLRAAS